MRRWAQGVYEVKNSTKYVGKSKPRYRSGWEFAFMSFCDNNDSILQWASESITIPYLNPLSGRQTIYVPDFFITYRTRDNQVKAEVIEIKPKKQSVIESKQSARDRAAVAVNYAKWDAATKWCRRQGLTFRVITEDDMFHNGSKQVRHQINAGKYGMTRKLESLFDLPSTDSEPAINDNVTEALPVTTETLSAIDKIEAALPAVRGLEASDNEMDDLAQSAMDSYNNLMDLGMSVEARFASEIFGVASNMLGHAITAKTAKMNKKLKMIDLQMKKLKMDRDNGSAEVPTAQGQLIDRNELLRQVLANNQNQQNE